ncbi:oligosaccharide flippase family protein, partial [Escherichia coli]|uniref:oligosaccharide flippase family protein n=1 Tax=Escherichia coli TaxID=562 RepID=UPI003EDEAC39
MTEEIRQARPFACNFNTPELYPVLFLLAFSFPISSLTITHKAKLEKEMNFKVIIA